MSAARKPPEPPLKPPPAEAPTLTWALWYAAAGFAVFPCHKAVNGVCTCRKRSRCKDEGKHPRTRRGAYAATRNPKKIRSWRWESANIGVATGEPSGAVVIDIDPRNDGERGFAMLEQRLGKLPATAVTITGGGGWHLWFRHPAGKLRQPREPGVDLKADGGYVVAPPSIHKSGNRYAWQLPPNGELPELPPAWLESLGCKPTNPAKRPADVTPNTGDPRPDVTPNAPNAPNAPRTLLNPPEVTGDKPRERPPRETRNGLSSEARLQRILEETQPRGPGRRHRCIFELVRRLKAFAPWKDSDPTALRPIVETWFNTAVEIVRTKDFEITWQDFLFGWEECQTPMGANPMTTMYEEARTSAPPARAADQYGEDSARAKLVSLCRLLQAQAGQEPFFLSARQVAEFLGVSWRHAARWLRQLQADRFIELIEAGSLSTKEASTYRYLGD
jgi:hypothetical protein